MSFSFEQLIHPQPSLTHVACISARQVASAAVAATSSTILTGSTRTAKPISSTHKQDQATHPAQPPSQPPLAKRHLLASPGSLSFRLDQM